MAIFFYEVNNEYGYFSNFAHFPFELEDKIWITSEHYFQAQKFTDDEYKEKIRLSKSVVQQIRSTSSMHFIFPRIDCLIFIPLTFLAPVFASCLVP